MPVFSEVRAPRIRLYSWAGLNGIAGCLLLIVVYFGHLLLGASAVVWLAWLLAGSLYSIWLLFGRFSVSPTEVRLVTGGWLCPHRYRAPLEAVLVNGCWLLDGTVRNNSQPVAVLQLEVAQEFDTDEEYLAITYNGEEIDHYFSLRQWPDIVAALTDMAALRHEASAARPAGSA
ncbi:hypothetical protein [Hymenobacter yonginensis]|uniref:PH domain-containing protein n=1 Tax=Hymenobacter yonginensis TaxID=748197 RepID=A0ABY7PT98_9BACT|nr:hypothetical protein [Hymenobacter yonginensis]WBO85774.1 hypothetical protein O9Z63_05890 [Hymenobacter yonginensis]